MGQKGTQKRESVKSVDVDVRLADIFNSHRNSQEESVAVEGTEAPNATTGSSDFDWLNQFISDAPTDSNSYISESNTNAVFEVQKNEVRAFHNSSGDSLYISLWKKSRGALAKDCQKQRKAALRKAIRR